MQAKTATAEERALAWQPGRRGGLDSAADPAGGEVSSAELVLHLNELAPVVRARLKIGSQLGEDALLASLAAIASRSSTRDRWRAAFNSGLGQWLASRGSDLNTSLNVLLALLPPPRM